MAEYNSSTYGDRIADAYDSLVPMSAQATAAAVDALARLAGPGPALELGVGTGRIAIPLAARGIAVHGIDGSQAMLDKLRSKPSGDKITIARADFEQIPLDRHFHLIYVVFNTFFALLTQEAQVRCFQSVADHLEPRGLFVIEAFVPDLTLYTRGLHISMMGTSNDSVRLNVAQLDAARQHITDSVVTLSECGTRLYPLQLRFAYPSELDLMARLAGLRLRERWSSWAGEPFTSQSGNHVSIYEKP